MVLTRLTSGMSARGPSSTMTGASASWSLSFHQCLPPHCLPNQSLPPHPLSQYQSPREPLCHCHCHHHHSRYLCVRLLCAPGSSGPGGWWMTAKRLSTRLARIFSQNIQYIQWSLLCQMWLDVISMSMFLCFSLQKRGLVHKTLNIQGVTPWNMLGVTLLISQGVTPKALNIQGVTRWNIPRVSSWTMPGGGCPCGIPLKFRTCGGMKHSCLDRAICFGTSLTFYSCSCPCPLWQKPHLPHL